MKIQPKLYTVLLGFLVSSSACKKTTNENCDACNPIKNTVYIAAGWQGLIGYNSNVSKWTVNKFVPNSIDGIQVAIICTDLPDSLKVIGKQVIFSGEIKESCANTNIQIGGQEIYSIKPSTIR